jgi:hypothetical protein
MHWRQRVSDFPTKGIFSWASSAAFAPKYISKRSEPLQLRVENPTLARERKDGAPSVSLDLEKLQIPRSAREDNQVGECELPNRFRANDPTLAKNARMGQLPIDLARGLVFDSRRVKA